jgi:hypothetical protein
MFEKEGEWTRLDFDFGGNHEDGLESNAFLANILLRAIANFRAASNLAYRIDILGRKSVFVGFDDYVIGI